jgi:hypothetical protein
MVDNAATFVRLSNVTGDESCGGSKNAYGGHCRDYR